GGTHIFRTFTRGAILSAAFALQAYRKRACDFSPHRWIRNAAMKIASAASYASNPKESGKH
ncbi:MAG: hypothetical protein WAK55_24355, partial [Xanthobacteraceae bacterium]